MPQCVIMAFIIYSWQHILRIGWILDCSKPFNSRETVPGTCIKLGFSLFYVILNLTWQCSLHKICI